MRKALTVFLAEPPQTRYDVHFWLGPFRVRVTPFFWLVAALLGWDLAIGLGDAAGGSRAGLFLVLWIAAVFISILVHELGHALAMAWYGMNASIVLYHFGGLAIPDSTSSFVSWGRSAGRGNQMVISAAGPAAQLLLAAAIALAVRLSGHRLAFPVPFLSYVIPLSEGQRLESPLLEAFLLFLILPSVFWALLNLVPVYPLDGGQLAREICLRLNPATGIRNSLVLSVVAGGGLAVYAFTHGDAFLGIMFGMLAYSSFQILQAYSGGGGRW